jgi:hypothetical protein
MLQERVEELNVAVERLLEYGLARYVTVSCKCFKFAIPAAMLAVYGAYDILMLRHS